MKVGNSHYRSIWYDTKSASVKIIDQRWLPHDFRIAELTTLADFESAIRDMWVRGAPLIGATAAWGIADQMARNSSTQSLHHAAETLGKTRPTAINLRWAIDRMLDQLQSLPETERAKKAHALALQIADEDVEINRQIGVHGLEILRSIAAQKPDDQPVNILTHCNAGWIATVDWGTATSPMYHAKETGLPIHVWVDETRPRNQGALTAWELGAHGIDHTYITDNAGGHLMQHGQVDVVIVGTDRTTATGDVCNKIGTYLKALAAQDNGVPFYVALPSPTIDWSVSDGLADIPIEDRAQDEVTHIMGAQDTQLGTVRVTPDVTEAANPAFDVTPGHLVTGLITERGIVKPNELYTLFPEKAA